MKRLDEKKDKILEYYDVGISIRKLAIKYECSFSAMKNHLKKWEVLK